MYVLMTPRAPIERVSHIFLSLSSTTYFSSHLLLTYPAKHSLQSELTASITLMMVKPVPPEPIRRRTFFSSTISIQPRPSTPVSMGAKASSNTVLAALSPPKDPSPNNTRNDKSSSKMPNHIEMGPDASNHGSGQHNTASGTDASRDIMTAPIDRLAQNGSTATKTSAVNTKATVPEVTRKGDVHANASKPPIDRSSSKTSFWKSSKHVSTLQSGPSNKEDSHIPASSAPMAEASIAPGRHSGARSSSATSRDRTGGFTPIAPAPSAASASTRRVTTPKHQSSEKRYMEAGFYCQDDFAKSPHKLVSKILLRREAESQVKQRKGQMLFRPDLNRPAFPPLPYDYGNELFFGSQHDFVLPFNIRLEAENGLLDGKKKPAAYSKLRASRSRPVTQSSRLPANRIDVFPERSRVLAPVHAVCRCDAESGCGDNCINRIMSYLCGRDCPCGDSCTNKSLAKRKTPAVKVNYVSPSFAWQKLTSDGFPRFWACGARRHQGG